LYSIVPQKPSQRSAAHPPRPLSHARWDGEYGQDEVVDITFGADQHSPMSTPSPIDRETFLQVLATRFPEIAENIGELESGLLHLEMGVVSNATREAITAENWQTVAVHFSFIAEVFAHGNEAIQNAVYVSYLENVLLGEASTEFATARAMLPPALAEAIVQLEAHFEMLAHAKPGT
jgi:hypothetical protein